MAISAADVEEARVLPRALAGATVLQIITALRDSTEARTAVSIARALVHAGARAIVAAGEGPLVNDLKSFGGEWLPFASATINPLRLRRNADRLEPVLINERVDIVHAKNAGAAWSALVATDRSTVRLVTDLPDLPHQKMRLAAFYLGGLSRGDRIIARSQFNAKPMLDRYRIPLERLSVIPRSIDTALFNPALVHPDRVAALRQAWGIPSRVRIVLAPGRVSPGNGQVSLVAAARMLAHNGMRGVTFVIAGDDRRHRRYARSIMKRARAEKRRRAVPRGRPRRRHAGGLRGVRHRRGAVHRAADLWPGRCRSAGDGAAGDRLGGRSDPGEHGDAAAHAERTAHRLGGAAGRFDRNRAGARHCAGAGRRGIPGAGRARPAVRRVHVRADPDRGRDA